MKATMRTLLAFKPRESEDSSSEAITLLRALIRLYLKDVDVAPAYKDSVVREVLTLFQQAVEICRKLQEASQLVVYAKDCAWLYKTAYNLAIQGMSSWENTDSILACFGVAVDLMRIYHNLQGVTSDSQLPQQMLMGLHACLCGYVFAARSTESNEQRTKLWQWARNILAEHRTALDRCPSPPAEIRAQAFILEVEILGSLKQWEEIIALLQSHQAQSLPLPVCEAVADISFQHGVPVAGVEFPNLYRERRRAERSTVTYVLQTLALKIATDSNQSSIVVLRWLRSVIDLLIHRKDSGDLENALQHIERARNIAQSKLNEVRDSEELEWLLATTWNQGLDYINLSNIGQAKAWLEQAIGFCSLTTDGEARLGQILAPMWAYKSYNDDAPDEDEPRFHPPPEPQEKASLFSWTSGLYNKSKKAPIGKLTGILAARRRKPARPARSRRSSFVSSFFSTRRSDHDGRLDKIIKLLELLAEDKVRTQEDQLRSSGRSRTSSRGSWRSRKRKDHDDNYVDDDDDDDDNMPDDDDGDYRQSGRPSSARRGKFGESSSLLGHRRRALEAAGDAGLEAALKDWRSKSSDGKKPGLQDRVKSSLKAGAMGAGRMGFKQVTHPSSKSRRHREDSDEESIDSFEGKANPIIGQLPALESMGKDRLNEMLKAVMKGNATQRPRKNEVAAFVSGYQAPGHSRFRKEMLHYAEESPGLDEEDLLDGILPPVGQYDFDDSPEPLDPVKRRRGKRDDVQEGEIGESHKAAAKSRPLHFDPKASSSVQAFDWPDKEEISRTRDDKLQTSKSKGKMVDMNDDDFAERGSMARQMRSSQRSNPKDIREDPEMMLRQLMQSSGGKGLDSFTEDDIRRLTKASLPDALQSRQTSSTQQSKSKDNDDDSERLLRQLMHSSAEEGLRDFSEDNLRRLTKASSQGAPKPETSDQRSQIKNIDKDPERLLRQLMQIPGEEGGENFNEDDLRRLSKIARGHVPSPLNTNIRKGESSRRHEEDCSRKLGMPPTSQAPDEGFGIAWPSTPHHDPSDEETLPEYESPTTEAFRLNQRQDSRPDSLVRPRSVARARETSPTPPVGRRNEVLFQRVLTTMRSCLDKSKDIAKKQQEYQGERLQPSTEQVILRIVGSWFMKQIPPLERADNLFAFADDDGMFEFLEELAKMSCLLGYPVLQCKRWDSDVYEHLQQEAESLQKCFLGVASVAVVKYLRDASSDLTPDMPRILDTCYDMLKATPNDPSQVLAIIPKIRAQSRDPNRQDKRKALEADGLLDILYELASEFVAGDASVSRPPEVSSPTATKEMSSTPRSLLKTSELPTQTSVSMPREESRVSNMPKQLPMNSSLAAAEGRGLAADFFDAPNPGPEGFSSAVLKDLEHKAEDFNQDYRRKGDNISKAPKEQSQAGAEKIRSIARSTDGLSRLGEQQMGGSLLMAERPKKTTAERAVQAPENTAQNEPEGRNSSSSSDEDHHGGHDAASILPSILRKKLEGRKRSTPKLGNSSKLGMLETLAEEASLQDVGQSDAGKRKRIPTKTRAASSLRSPSKTRAIQSIIKRVPGSYFPPADDLVNVETGDLPKSQPRLRPGPIVSKASIYTPATASPLRASISVVSAEPLTRSSGGAEMQLQRPTATVSSPTGVVFSNPFSGDTAAPVDIDSLQTPPAVPTAPMDTVDTSARPDLTTTSPGTSPKASLVEAIQDYAGGEMIFLTPMASPILAQDAEILADDAENSEEEVTDVTDVSDTSDSASIGSNEVLTSEDIRAGALGDHDMENLVDHGPEPLTEAEKDLVAREPEALVPGPRGVISSQDVRNHSVSFNDFSRAYTGAVPRVEVTPGAIQNTQGEIIPIEDEDIHLEAGDTLIDGTGRVWNSRGLIEPGRDDQGKTILYEVDIAQIKRANNGVMPAMMPWDDDEWMDDEPGTPSYDPDGDTVSATTPASSMNSSLLDTPAGRAGRLRGSQRRESDVDRIDDQLANGFSPGVSEYGDDDEPLDDMDMQAEEERINAEEEADMIRASVNEQKKMGLI
ncbi:hypothetical protein QFC21_005732 [Naganishia friedmannii]|uniref:Uncharacterized protein n=1 Tax=Naganishia friedmannii TaxID=89922 RepID=A0ACC2V734_9TREE|nr:hypothetical protein QFC21_005732 [Naganishia friedmannii]